MKKHFNLSAVTDAILHRGALLIFPVQNKKEPPSVWAEFFPKTEMKWEWDDSADNRVVQLWHIKTELPSTGKVIYTKWYQNKATALAPDVWSALAAILSPPGSEKEGLSREARTLLDVLESDSPLSSKVLKKTAGMSGAQSKHYDRGMRELWARCLVVALGEVDDGAFPSLEIGASSVVQESLWRKSRSLSVTEAVQLLQKRLGKESYFLQECIRLKKKAPAAQTRIAVPSESHRPLMHSVSFEELRKNATSRRK